VDPSHRLRAVSPAPALFLALAALFILGASAQHAGRAADADDCASGRDAGTAPPACYALSPDSPYASGGIGGTRIGADAATLDRIAACVAAGDTRSSECAMAPLPTAGISLPTTPSGFRITH
jgi:hypothetical protein